MTWFDFPGWGLYELNGVAEKELASTFAHGYATQAEAQAHPNDPPDAEQAALLQGFNAASLSPAGAGVSGVLQTPHSTGGITGASANLAGDVFKSLNLSNWLVRIGEIIVGIVLVGIGVNAMFRAKPLQVVTSAAGTIAKVVP